MRPSSVSFPFSPGTAPRSKMLLAEQAALAAQSRTISLAQAKDHISSTEFKLGGNRFQLFLIGEYKDPKLTALVVSHLGSAFTNQSIGLYFTQDSKKITYVTVKVGPFGVDHSSSLYGPAAKGPELFSLCFNINPGYLEMSHLASTIRKGGAGVVALYNIAKEYGITTIKYNVHDHNLNAKLFYHNMNFGSPLNDQWTEWEVKVI